MATNTKIKDILERVENIKPLFGKTYSVKDVDVLKDKAIIEQSETSSIKLNADGTVADLTDLWDTAVPSILYDNRFEVEKDKDGNITSFLVVMGLTTESYMALKSKSNGQPCPYMNLTAYRFARQGKGISLKGAEIITAEEWNNKFNGILNEESANTVLLQILDKRAHKNDKNKSEMPI